MFSSLRIILADNNDPGHRLCGQRSEVKGMEGEERKRERGRNEETMKYVSLCFYINIDLLSFLFYFICLFLFVRC